MPPSDGVTCSCQAGGNLIAYDPQALGAHVSQYSTAPVRYADGVVRIAATDLSSDGFGTPWGQTRSWTNGLGYATGGDNGNGWVDTQTPHLMQADGSTDDTIVAITNGTTANYYDLVDGAYQSRYDDPSTLVHDAADDEFVLTDASGDQIHFGDFNTPCRPPNKGRSRASSIPPATLRP